MRAVRTAILCLAGLAAAPGLWAIQPPTGLSAVSTGAGFPGSGQVQLSWSAPPVFEPYYQIYYSTWGSSFAQALPLLSVTSTSQVVSMATGLSIAYFVTSGEPGLTSTASGPAYATPYVAPAWTYLMAVTGGANTLSLAWSAADVGTNTPVAYQVTRADDLNGTNRTLVSQTTALSLTGLAMAALGAPAYYSVVVQDTNSQLYNWLTPAASIIGHAISPI